MKKQPHAPIELCAFCCLHGYNSWREHTHGLYLLRGGIDRKRIFICAVRFQLRREDVPTSKRVRFQFMVNTDKEYMAGFRYIVTKYFGLSTHYDSDMGYGAGLTLNY